MILNVLSASFNVDRDGSAAFQAPAGHNFNNSRMQNHIVGETLRNDVSKKLLKRANEIPRDNIQLVITLQEYDVYCACFDKWRRVELNGKDRRQLIFKALREKRVSGHYLVACREPTRPKSETREEHWWSSNTAGSSELGRFLSAHTCLLQSVDGLENHRVLPTGEIVCIYSASAKFTFSPETKSQRITVTFSYCVLRPGSRAVVFNPHSRVDQGTRVWIRKQLQAVPDEIRVRNRRCTLPERYFSAREYQKYKRGTVAVAPTTAVPTEPRVATARSPPKQKKRPLTKWEAQGAFDAQRKRLRIQGVFWRDRFASLSLTDNEVDNLRQVCAAPTPVRSVPTPPTPPPTDHSAPAPTTITATIPVDLTGEECDITSDIGDSEHAAITRADALRAAIDAIEAN